MSYCRWSSNSYRCDVYVYEDVRGGWTTHVAGRRHIEGPIVTASPVDEFDEWLQQHQELTKFLKTAECESIDHPAADKSFNDPTPGECADRLEQFKQEGLLVPQEAIDDLREEQKELDNA